MRDDSCKHSHEILTNGMVSVTDLSSGETRVLACLLRITPESVSNHRHAAPP